MAERALDCACPYCAGSMRPVVMRCPACQAEVRGRFRQTVFQLLDEHEQRLLEDYLLSDFSIKALAQRTGLGYAALRTRIDRLIEHYDELVKGEEEKRRILAQVAQGTMTAAEAADRIAELDTA